MSILSSTEFQGRLSESLANTSKLEILSGYITSTAVGWLASLAPKNCSVSIVSSLTVSDLVSGASDLSAIEIALQNGWHVYALPRLHAKIYVVNDSKVFVGSSNFTTNGLKLYGTGNIEGTVELEATSDHLDFVTNILKKSDGIDSETLEKMKGFLESIDLTKSDVSLEEWPEYFFDSTEDLWTHDLLWYPPKDLFIAENVHDRDLLSISDDTLSEVSVCFRKSKIFRWLLKKLSESKNGEIYYGELSASLHLALLDDPGLYRKSVKEYLSILLIYCSKYAFELMAIDRPNYSQRVYLLK